MPFVPYHDIIVDSTGRPIVSCNVAVLTQSGIGQYANTAFFPGNPLANVYANANGSVLFSNPLGLNNGIDPLGNLDFYVEAGVYTLQFGGLLIFQPITQVDTVIEGVVGIGGESSVVFQVVATDPGSFVVNHGLGVLPSAVTFSMSNTDTLGQFWLDTSTVALGYDTNNVYCISSDADISGQVIVFTGAGPSAIRFTTETVNIAPSSIVGILSNTPTLFASLTRNGLGQRTPQDFQVIGSTVIVNVAAVSGDVFYAGYYF